MVNPEVTPPPLITTVKPLPINPKQLLEQGKSPDLERNLLEVETSAIEYLTAREEKQHEQQIDDGPIADSENESIFGEIVRKAAEHAAGKKRRRIRRIEDLRVIYNSSCMQLQTSKRLRGSCWM